MITKALKEKSKLPIRYYTTNEAATMLGMARGSLANWLCRNKAYKPKRRAGSGNKYCQLAWTDKDIIRVARERYRV